MHGHGKFTWPSEIGQATYIGLFRDDRRVKGKVYDGKYRVLESIDREEDEVAEGASKSKADGSENN